MMSSTRSKEMRGRYKRSSSDAKGSSSSSGQLIIVHDSGEYPFFMSSPNALFRV